MATAWHSVIRLVMGGLRFVLMYLWEKRTTKTTGTTNKRINGSRDLAIVENTIDKKSRAWPATVNTPNRAKYV